MRKLFLLFWALLATTCLWAHDFEVDGIYYNYLDDNNVAVTYKGSSYYAYSNEYSGEVTIPETVTYNGTTYSVTSIGDYAFDNCSSLTSITIPNSVTSIGNFAFAGCSSLTSPVYNAHCFAYMPPSFEGAYTIPDGIKQIAGSAFAGCSSLTSITIPNSVTSIGEWAFSYCRSLTSITIPNSVTSIGDMAFYDCSSLTSPVYNAHCFAYMPPSFEGAYTIPDGIKQIAGGAFSDCTSLTSITIPESVTLIGNNAFVECSSLISVTIPNSVISIGDWAFQDCTSLTSIIIPNSVTSIGNSAFSSCSSLTSITIPNSVTSIGKVAFYGCSSITSMIVEEGNTTYDSRDNCNAIIETASNTLIAVCQNTIIPNSVTSIGECVFEGCSSLTSITIPESVTSIGNSAFSSCRSLTSITIPNSVTSIGESAFNNCSSLTSITIPESVTSIGKYAFSYCSALKSIVWNAKNCADPSSSSMAPFYGITSQIKSFILGENVENVPAYLCYKMEKLTSITIPESVTSIGNSAFSSCRSLTSITIPNSVTSIGDEAFSNCSSLPVENNLRYADTYLVEAVDKTLSTYSIKDGTKWIGSRAFDYCYSLTSITIPNSVTSIGDFAFSWCSSLTSLTIPNSVTNIGNYAFENCDALTSITIPNSVTSIGNRAFEYCPSLTSVTIGNSVTSIGNDAFHRCYSLTSITIPNSVTNIGLGAFSSCYNVTSIVVESDNDIYDSRENCNAIIETATNTLIAGCQNTVIPNSVTSIGESAFSGCSALTSITIPNSVTSIGNRAFLSCTSLISVTIPNSVTSIGEYAFFFCSDLTSVTIPNSVTSIGDWAFVGCSSLTSIIIPNSVMTIGADAFDGCRFAKDNFVNNSTLDAEANNYWGAELVDTEFDGLLIRNDTVIDCREFITSVSIPNSVTSIGEYAFSGCSALTSITIPNSVTSIGSSAFSGCSFASITIPNSVTSIGDWAFWGCSSLTSVTINSDAIMNQHDYLHDIFGSQVKEYVIGDSITEIRNNTFQNFYSLESVTIGKNVTSIGENAFEGCSALDSIVWNAKNYINFSKKENAPFYDCRSQIKSFTFGEAVEHIPAYLCYGMEKLTNMVLFNKTKTISTSAFEGCIRLGKLSLGAAIENIAATAFAGCNRLYHIYCYPTYPPFADQSSFANYNVYLHVPCDYKEGYDLDMVWGNFKYIECMGAESEPSAPDTVIVTPGTNDVTITWPTEDNAYHYVIEIKKDGVVFCTLTFNAGGQLLNIAFAPSRDGNKHPAQYAEQVANGGLRFTVTGLEAGTNYTYDVVTTDQQEKEISTYSGEFTTKGGTTTDMENIQSPVTTCQKIMHNGQLIILRDGQTYTIMGAEIQ